VVAWRRVSPPSSQHIKRGGTTAGPATGGDGANGSRGGRSAALAAVGITAAVLVAIAVGGVVWRRRAAEDAVRFPRLPGPGDGLASLPEPGTASYDHIAQQTPARDIGDVRCGRLARDESRHSGGGGRPMRAWAR